MTSRLTLVELLDARISSLPGVERKRSRWRLMTGYFAHGREIAHFHSDHKIDIRLTRLRQRQLSKTLSEDRRVRFRPKPSEWVWVGFSTPQDTDFVVGLVEQAVKGNR